MSQLLPPGGRRGAGTHSRVAVGSRQLVTAATAAVTSPYITGLVVALKAVTDKATAFILAVVGDVGGLIPALALERPS